MRWNWKNAFVGLTCASLLWLLVGLGHSEEARKAEGPAISNELMEQWQRKNPGRDWVAEEKALTTLISCVEGSRKGTFTASILSKISLCGIGSLRSLSLKGQGSSMMLICWGAALRFPVTCATRTQRTPIRKRIQSFRCRWAVWFSCGT